MPLAPLSHTPITNRAATRAWGPTSKRCIGVHCDATVNSGHATQPS
eukprot:gene38276-16093_t